jgi:hypothetical protein
MFTLLRAALGDGQSLALLLLAAVAVAYWRTVLVIAAVVCVWAVLSGMTSVLHAAEPPHP